MIPLGKVKSLPGIGLENSGAPSHVRGKPLASSSPRTAALVARHRAKAASNASRRASARAASERQGALSRSARVSPEGQMYATAQGALPLRSHTGPDLVPLMMQPTSLSGALGPIPSQKLVAGLPSTTLRAAGVLYVWWIANRHFRGTDRNKHALFLAALAAYAPVLTAVGLSAYFVRKN